MWTRRGKHSGNLRKVLSNFQQNRMQLKYWNEQMANDNICNSFEKKFKQRNNKSNERINTLIKLNSKKKHSNSR